MIESDFTALALAELTALADPEKATQAAAYHKTARPYLGVTVPQIDALAKTWRETLTLDARLDLAEALWDTNIHEARVASAKLLTQARIRPDDSRAWDLICTWTPQFDAWAIADHTCKAGEKRIIADPSRLETAEAWTTHSNMWARRAALVMTLPYTKLAFPKAVDLEARDRILGWAAGYLGDKDWFIQKAIAWWVRELSKHAPDRARQFLAEHGPAMKSFARKEAAQYLTPHTHAADPDPTTPA